MNRTLPAALCVALALAACGGNDNPPPDTGDMAGGAQPDMTTNTNNGPKIISLGTNVNQLTSGESVRFVAVVTDPSGLQNLVGGQLVSPDGTIKYGAFIASQQGSYNLDLSWSAINQAQGINFAASESRTFVAEFYNTAAQKSSQAITLKLHCDLNGMTRGACNGVCSAEGATCGGGGGRICVAGACGLGCYIGKMLVKPDAANPSNSCQSCQPTQLTSDWSNLPEDTSCGAGVYCRTGSCVVRFQRRIGAGAALFSGNLNAITPIAAKTAFAVNSNGAIFLTSDAGLSWSVSYNAAVPDSFYGIASVSSTDAFAVGVNGRFARTSTGGGMWTVGQIPMVTATLNEVWGSSASDVYAVGTTGTIVRWNGSAWAKQTNPATDVLNSVHGAGGSVYAVGVAGTILKTTNQGTTWTRLTSNSVATLYSVFATSASDVWTVGGTSTLLHSTDGGQSWTKLTFTDASNLYSVWAAASTVYVGTSTGIYRSTDGGMKWTQQGAPGATAGQVVGTGVDDIWASVSGVPYHNY